MSYSSTLINVLKLTREAHLVQPWLSVWEISVSTFSFEGFLMLYQFAVAPSSMVWMGIYWVGGKCTFNVVSSAVMLNRHRLYKLFACYVSTLSVVRSRVRNPLSGWTLGTTSMTGQPPTTRIMRITCRRSDLSHQAGLSLNPDSQLSMSQCIVRPRLTLLKPNLTIQGEISKTRSRYDSYLHQTARSSQTDSYLKEDVEL